MARRLNGLASAIVRRLNAGPKPARKSRAPLAAAVASAVVTRLGRGRGGPVSASAVQSRLASRRGAGPGKRGRLSHPAARGPSRRPSSGPPGVASGVGRALSTRSRKSLRGSLASAVASAVISRLKVRRR